MCGGGAVEAAAPGRGSGQDRCPRCPCIWPGCCIWARSSRWRFPQCEQEAARDLVRAREDCRGDLMTARHRLSKLLLRQGIVYYGGTAWTGKHERWLRTQRFDTRGLQLAYDSRLRRACWPPSTGATALMRRSPRWPPIRLHPGGDPAGLPARGLDADRVRAGRRDRRLASADRPHDRRLPGVGAHRVLLGCHALQGGITKTGNGHARRLLVEAAWHHRPPYRPGRRCCGGGGTRPAPRPGPAARPPTGACTHRWTRFDERKKRPVVANAAIARELAGWCWSLAVIDD